MNKIEKGIHLAINSGIALCGIAMLKLVGDSMLAYIQWYQATREFIFDGNVAIGALGGLAMLAYATVSTRKILKDLRKK